MPGRQYVGATGYAYGFGGQLKDDEISGNGISYTAEFWQYDPRLGRRWNRDPILKPWEASYATFSNSPILFNDPVGLDVIPANKEVKKDIKYLKKIDPEFKKKYNQWKKEYSGKGNDLHIAKIAGSGDLNTATPQETNNSNLDPHKKVDKKTGEILKDTDYIFYTDLKHEATEVVFTQTQTFEIAVSATKSSNFNHEISTSIPSVYFKSWSYFYMNEIDKRDMISNVTILYNDKTNTNVNFNFKSLIKPLNSDYDHAFGPNTQYVSVVFQAMSIPTIINGVITREKGWQYDFKNKLDSNTPVSRKDIYPLAPNSTIQLNFK